LLLAKSTEPANLTKKLAQALARTVLLTMALVLALAEYFSK